RPRAAESRRCRLRVAAGGARKGQEPYAPGVRGRKPSARRSGRAGGTLRGGVTPLETAAEAYARMISHQGHCRRTPEAKGTTGGTPDLVSHHAGGWALHLLPGGRFEGWPDTPPAPRAAVL